MKDYSDALQIENGCYKTTPRPTNVWARLFPGLVFYSKIIKVVFGASKDARSGRLTDNAYRWYSVRVLRAVEAVGGTVEMMNLNAAPSDGWPYVFVGNHMGTLETMLLASVLIPKGPISFVIKESLTKYPVFKHVMLNQDPIVVGRENPREDLTTVLKEGQQQLKEGKSVIIFPQRTRSLTFDPSTFNSIGIKLARRAGVPIIPIAIRTDFWGKGKWVKELGPISPERPVQIKFHPPLSISGRGEAEHQKSIDFIQSTVDAWLAETDNRRHRTNQILVRCCGNDV
ncbi:MAG: lysophospholipid acyltransferase family protein [candidate division KSB1 bacterium]|nr:lysophospholipid acyltransferase family protein [candidate division KSB1 bacterium]